MNGVRSGRHRALGVDQTLKTADLLPVAQEPDRTDFHDPIGFRHQPGRLQVEGDVFPFERELSVMAIPSGGSYTLFVRGCLRPR